jgi:hypothetical protein
MTITPKSQPSGAARVKATLGCATAGGTVHLFAANGVAPFIAFTEGGSGDRGAIGFNTGSADLVYKSASSSLASGTERLRVTSVGNLKTGGTAGRGTTEGTNQIVIFNGTAPAGTLANGVSLYSDAGELKVADAARSSHPFSRLMICGRTSGFSTQKTLSPGRFSA